MTMVPSSQVFINQQLYDGYGDSYTETICFMNTRLLGYESFSSCCLGSDHLLISPMAEDGSRISSVNEEKEGEEEEEAGSSSKVDDQKWLQLGLGSTSTSSSRYNNMPMSSPQLNNHGRLLELDLLPTAGVQVINKPVVPSLHHLTPDFSALRHPSNTTSTLLQHPRFSFPQHEVTWGYRPHPYPWAPSPSSPSSSSQVALGPYYPRASFQQQQSVGPSSSTRIIRPPRRPDSNIWFSLEASQNQSKQPFLPQIPKSYLRIKDGRMTVRVLIKYLATKLHLDSESEEIEIRCREQELVPSLTLQHVRDTIWTTTTNTTARDAAADYVMILRYGWRRSAV